MPSEEAADGSGSSSPVSRRAVLGGLGLLPLAAAVGVLPAASADTGYRFLTAHQAAVLDAATRCLIPGPEDNPLERSPGAHEANVVGFLDTMLSAFSFSPPMVHAGGPWSNRAGGTQDFMADFVPLDRAQTYGWQQRIAGYRQQYTNGIALLDQQAGGDFTSVPKVRQDLILGGGKAVSFTKLLFSHTVEAMYSVPEYGGNANLVGWQDIKWPGDNQPTGYTNAEVEAPEWDLVGTSGIIDTLVRGGWQQAFAKMGGTGGVNAH
ncbi:MAG: gluconate 2-dehydrogenase subunit 3 family protein [Mycobacterium sp.]|uniref:gluconate 2-dehydrogenase subunit 3 family protein n=1 Tax=Mycobacterium sp. TaxID=1785 RepID=UPI003F986A4C